jgi:hypothetical protein
MGRSLQNLRCEGLRSPSQEFSDDSRNMFMSLTALQRTVLESYRTFRESPLPVWRLMALASKSHAILFIIFSLLSII